ncbi:citrate lyase holo-[acyl-carrier protein] synthase [Furfurilactobacillus sp. WILCCON 0119]|uniref:citrate lyase holo-[acyl-carrier protein] synthase n=1 Tax=Furfurilactobacillus entadae TaxID=2922307 RepID=UPI0035E67A82
MVESIFQTGAEQSIADVLANRDERVALQQELAARYPGKTVVAIKLNIPGPIKNNQQLGRLFDTGLNQWRSRVTGAGLAVIDSVSWDKPTGREQFYVIDGKGDQLKHLAVEFEDQYEVGRLFDVDVLMALDGHLRALSRTNFGLPVRQCLLCERPAKDCARSRRHSVEDLQEAISTTYAGLFGGPIL